MKPSASKLTKDQISTLLSFVDREASFEAHTWQLNEKGRHDVLGRAAQTKSTCEHLADYALARFNLVIHPSSLRHVFSSKLGQLRASPNNGKGRRNGHKEEAPRMFGLTALELLDKAIDADTRGAKDVAQRLFELAASL
jgi:hypothetical protein